MTLMDVLTIFKSALRSENEACPAGRRTIILTCRTEIRWKFEKDMAAFDARTKGRSIRLSRMPGGRAGEGAESELGQPLAMPTQQNEATQRPRRNRKVSDRKRRTKRFPFAAEPALPFVKRCRGYN